MNEYQKLMNKIHGANTYDHSALEEYYTVLKKQLFKEFEQKSEEFLCSYAKSLSERISIKFLPVGAPKPSLFKNHYVYTETVGIYNNRLYVIEDGQGGKKIILERAICVNGKQNMAYECSPIYRIKSDMEKNGIEPRIFSYPVVAMPINHDGDYKSFSYINCDSIFKPILNEKLITDVLLKNGYRDFTVTKLKSKSYLQCEEYRVSVKIKL